MAVSQAFTSAAPGAENRLPQACRTVVLVKAFSRPPMTMAVKIASTVTVAELLGRHGRRPEAGNPAVVDDRDPVGERVDLVELGGDDEHGRAPVAFGDDAAVDELDGAHVKTPGGLAGHEQLVLAAQLPGQD